MVLGDENDDDDDDEVSALTRAGTMLRYGYQPAHKTALALPPICHQVYSNGRERAILSPSRRYVVFAYTTTRIVRRRSKGASYLYNIYYILSSYLKKIYIYLINKIMYI